MISQTDKIRPATKTINTEYLKITTGRTYNWQTKKLKGTGKKEERIR